MGQHSDLSTRAAAFTSLAENLLGADTSMLALATVQVIEGERQVAAIREQTETLNAGQFALWRQTPEGQVYLEWQRAALAYIKLLTDRTALFAAAQQEDDDELARRTPRPDTPEAVGLPKKPEPRLPSSYERVWTALFFAVAAGAVWLLVEIVLSIVGKAGLINNWGLLAILIGLGWIVARVNAMGLKAARESAHYYRAVDEWAGRVKRIESQNAAAVERHQQQLTNRLDDMSAQLGRRFGEKVSWAAADVPASVETAVRDTLLHGRERFPAPDDLPELKVPAVRADLGPASIRANRLLTAFRSATSSGGGHP